MAGLLRSLSNLLSTFRSADPAADQSTRAWLGGEGSRSRAAVTRNTALGVSAVWSCVSLVADTIAGLPLHLIQFDGNQNKTIIRDHDACRLLRSPEEAITYGDLMFHLISSTMLTGNGYALIHRGKDFAPVKIECLDANKISIRRETGSKQIVYLLEGQPIAHYDVIHIKGFSVDGLSGLSPLRIHRENLQLSMAAKSYGELFFSQGGNTAGVFETEGQYTEEAYKRLVEQLQARMGGLQNSHRPLLLEGGLKYSRITIPPEDAQFLGTRTFQKGEIASIYKVPPHMIGDLSRSTNNNIEQQAREFVQYCLMPYINKIEDQFSRKILREDEQNTLQFNIDVNGLMRGDSKTRAEYYRILLNMGAITPNQVAQLEDFPRYEGGDNHFMQSNMMQIEKIANNNE